MSSAPEAAGAITRELDAVLEYPDLPAFQVLVRVLHRGRRERILRAAGTLGTCWVLAVVTVFLPLLHFVLVPGLLLLGPALAWARLHEERTLLGVDGACPACTAPLREALSQPWRERTLMRCDACSRQLTLVLANVEPEPESAGKLPIPGLEPPR